MGEDRGEGDDSPPRNDFTSRFLCLPLPPPPSRPFFSFLPHRELAQRGREKIWWKPPHRGNEAAMKFNPAVISYFFQEKAPSETSASSSSSSCLDGHGDRLQRYLPFPHGLRGEGPFLDHRFLLDPHGDVDARFRGHHLSFGSGTPLFHRGAAVRDDLSAHIDALHLHQVLLCTLDRGRVEEADAAGTAAGNTGPRDHHKL